nr:PREDICTED: uncharacterized protein LOC107398186 isoform X2 [Tribolium castaneum]|eukprot:XP_015836897.1 PREDICTED: uncharacterized protein LOC107398186 isoform X2 [Tribolium castaneum]
MLNATDNSSQLSKGHSDDALEPRQAFNKDLIPRRLPNEWLPELTPRTLCALATGKTTETCDDSLEGLNNSNRPWKNANNNTYNFLTK